MSRQVAHTGTPRVVKLGGSLFEYDGLASALRRWLAEPPPMGLPPFGTTIFLAGGGELADAIRRADARHSLGEEASHWLCVQLLGVTARMLARLLCEADLINAFDELRRRLGEPSPGVLVFDPGEFLRSWEPKLAGECLPHTWRTTSDSIAARLAEVLAADLVLLKSADPPVEFPIGGDRATWLRELAARDYVDGSFPQAAASVRRVEMVNLRDLGNPHSPREFHANRA